MSVRIIENGAGSFCSEDVKECDEASALSEIELLQVLKVFAKLKAWRDEDARMGMSRTQVLQ